MRTLQKLLVILDGQKLSPGYLTPPKPTALECAIELKRLADTDTINGASRQTPNDLLFASAWVGSLGAGKDAIFLADVQGRLDLSHGSQQPAYIFTQPV
jgi:hypothetical protein